jgi:hypothetical protein
MTQSNEDLEAIYGSAALFAEHKRGDHITYMTAEGVLSEGLIVWCQAPIGEIGLRYVVAPDEPTGFVDFVVPGDVITSIQETQKSTMRECPYCRNLHESHLIESCPLKPNT